ncbi:ATP-binding protein [Pseudothermotoga thermarum]|uniref:histidine kinase n=1 Tax=Pseudothermotoga thermarum DSM 5069 TaxID=688269 RepID=F7YU63_9THEM|nr:ATP-binding protein [Pseudothermotoga thermarum]AEH50159.1 histidine kinase [Pseudothermotoga thermarum DSM 5069]
MGLRTIADHIMDIVQNSFNAGATRIVLTIIENSSGTFYFKVEDNGRGMDEEELQKVFDPFYTTRDHRIRKVGLGLPFLKYAAELTGGKVSIQSQKGVGTIVEATFNTRHVDCQDVGDLAGTISTLLLMANDVELVVKRFKDEEGYQLSSSELKQKFGDLSSPIVMKVVFDLIEELEASLKKG